MKKLLSVLLAVMLLGLTACGQAPQESSASSEEETVSIPNQALSSQPEEPETSSPEQSWTEEIAEKEGSTVEQITVSGKTVHLYLPQRVKDHPEEKVPLVLFMCGTSCDPLGNLIESGWPDQAEKEGFVVISPDYNNYATYSETGFLVSVVDYMLEHYPIDPARVYSTGFSNGGAASIALTRDYPQYFAAISAMGWMIGLDDKDGVYGAYDMPFQVVQGDGEFTVRTPSGAMAVMDDEKQGVRDLMLYNEMLSPAAQPDYDKTPYWGYEPDDSHSDTRSGRRWDLCDYYKEGYSVPFAQLIIVEDDQHRPRPEEAEIAWAFFRNFRRENGQIIEAGSQPAERSLPMEPLAQREFHDLPYDTLSAAQTLDLFLPEEGEGPFPLVLFIHGGGWFSGHKSDGQERAWVRLRENGYAVASVNYRLSGEAAHPAGIIDCKTALRYLRANAAAYHLDTGRVAAAGDSSGGHYALMLALTAEDPAFEDLTRGYAEESAQVQCAVVWYPATDLAETMRTVQAGEYTGFGASFAWDNIQRYVGKTITDPADPTLVAASPVQYVSAEMPPVLLQHGDADSICPIDQSRRFLRMATAAAGEGRVALDVIPGAEHGDAVFETEENMARVRAFLDKYLAL